jgi:hypothetical protein
VTRPDTEYGPGALGSGDGPAARRFLPCAAPARSCGSGVSVSGFQVSAYVLYATQYTARLDKRVLVSCEIYCVCRVPSTSGLLAWSTTGAIACIQTLLE